MPFIHIKGKTKVPKGTMEDFNRPKHPDFLTTSELKKTTFSGMRHNQITNQTEIWTLGDLRGAVPYGDKDALSKLYEEIFGISLDQERR